MYKNEYISIFFKEIFCFNTYAKSNEDQKDD